MGKKLHKKHRDVLFGTKPLVIDSHKLPDSQKAYVRRHNDELARAVQQRQLQAAFEKAALQQEGPVKGAKPDVRAKALSQVALAVVALLAS